MSMLDIAIVSAASVIIAICTVIIHWRTSGVIERTTKQAITGCPPEKLPAVLRASAELARRLRGDHLPPVPPANPLSRLFRR